MANLEDVIRDLREVNSELAHEVQSLKILAAQKDKEKLELTKEVNELRLKISRLRSGGAAQIRKLDTRLQSATEEALSHLVQASGAVARTIEIAKQYIQERQDLDCTSPKWSNISSSSGDKIHKVPPLLLGGQSIQPVVSLSRTILNNRSMTRSPNQNAGAAHRALPMHMLQDVYIPLTRIDVADLNMNNVETEELQTDNSVEDLGLEDSNEQVEQENEESQNLASVDELDETHGLDAVLEESVEQTEETPQRNLSSIENPLEGPSWLLDAGYTSDRANSNRGLEPDSTTPCETPLRGFEVEPPPTSNLLPQSSERLPQFSDRLTPTSPSSARLPPTSARLPASARLPPEEEGEAAMFTPTVRRRKRTLSPPLRKHSAGRELKVMVAKMRLSDDSFGASGDSSPPKRQALRKSTAEDNRRANLEDSRRSTLEEAPRRPVLEGSPREAKEVARPPRFDAPSPNGATDAAVIVCETQPQVNCLPRASRHDSRGSRTESRAASRSASRLEYSDSDNSSAGDAADTRTRRPRKQVSYKEKPLNRKLRR